MLTEVEILKEKLEKNQLLLQKALDDKDTANKEFERMLEKYDRYAILLEKNCFIIFFFYYYIWSLIILFEYCYKTCFFLFQEPE